MIWQSCGRLLMLVNRHRVSRIGAQSPGGRLYALERRERYLAARMQRDRIARTLLQEAITRLRCSLDEEDAVQYRTLVFVKTGHTR